MRNVKQWMTLGATTLAASAVAVWLSLTGCSEGGASEAVSPGPDASTDGLPDASTAALPDGQGPAASLTEHLLVSVNGASRSEVFAVNLASRAVDGRFSFDTGLGSASTGGALPLVIQQGNDLVVTMNAQKPWEPLGSWNVAGDDQPADAGPGNSQPLAAVVPTGSAAFILRYNRNRLAVIDTAQTADAAAPVRYIELSSLLQSGDGDGQIDVTSAVYVPRNRRIYVLLGGYDRTAFAADQTNLACLNLSPSVIAIDAVTGELISLGGTAPGGGIALKGYNPWISAPLVYDEAGDRLLVLHGGCSSASDTRVQSASASGVQRRGIEEVSLATNASTMLVSFDGATGPTGFPSSLTVTRDNAAVVAFTYPAEAFVWNTRKSALGPKLSASFDWVTRDAAGNVFGVATRKAADAQPARTDVVVSRVKASSLASWIAAEGASGATPTDAGGETATPLPVETFVEIPNVLSDQSFIFVGGASVWPPAATR